MRSGNVQRLRSDTIAGLPLTDSLPAIDNLSPDELALISTALTGETSALTWFRNLNLQRVATIREWLLYTRTGDEMRDILRSWSKLSGREMRLYAPDLPRPYNTGAGNNYFLPLYRDFEPYQGYFERIIDEEARRAIEKAAGHPVDIAIYFRLYGAERVIAEGVWAGARDEVP